MLREGQVLFTYLHLAADPKQAEALVKSGCTAIDYETVTAADRSLPLLTPMSEVAGRLSIQAGAFALGDEQADFSDMLRKFKQGVSQNVDDEDHEAHYDLGVAYKEMGLLDEAISEFQIALRGTKDRVRAFEALGHCFIEKQQLPVANTILQRALAEPGVRDEALVGVLYLLGVINEQLSNFADAKKYFERVFSVDIQFRDIGDRLNAVEAKLR
jgi:tetratricopeptide (TPR) repeat protein